MTYPDPDAVEIGKLYRLARQEQPTVTDIRYFPPEKSQSRNTEEEESLTPDACHHCREPFTPGRIRYPVLDAVPYFERCWDLVSVCGHCFKHCTECNGVELPRFKRPCLGCGEPMQTPIPGPFRWQVCSIRCRQRNYRKRRRENGGTSREWRYNPPPKCAACKKPMKTKRKDARFCSARCKQWAYRRRKE